MQRTNEENLDLFADLLEPSAEIIGDKEIAQILRDGEPPIKAVKLAIKNHKAAIVNILAAVDGEDATTYKIPNPAALAIKLLNFLNSPELQELFTSQTPKGAASSGSATENIEGGAV